MQKDTYLYGECRTLNFEDFSSSLATNLNIMTGIFDFGCWFLFFRMSTFSYDKRFLIV